ncbi:MAG: DoxX family protein [Candidatus Limnocylindrales bacterium]
MTVNRHMPAVRSAIAGARRLAPDILAALFAVSGAGHLARPASYEALIPPFLPAPGAIIAISGAAEIICAVGLLRRDWWAGPMSAALLVAVFPGNVWFALATTSAVDSAGLLVVVSWLRLPLQLPLIWAALQSNAGARHR